MSTSLLNRHPPLAGRFWLVLALLLTLLPHLSRLPGWLAAAALLVIGWRLLRDYRDWPLPSRGFRLFVTVLAIGAIVVVFRTILGREPGTALLSVLICLKLLELRTLRDAMLVIFLGYFLVVANFLFEDSIFTGFYMFTVVLILSATLITLNHPAAAISQSPFYLKQAGVLLLQALPLMALLFILFPRIDSPLWRIPEPTTQNRTGMSDEMSPGDITQLAESDELVFRAEFSGTLPSADKLYWRGPVLWQTDGRRWNKLAPQQMARIASHALRYESSDDPIHYAIMLEQQRGNWLFALDLPAALPEIEGGALLQPDFQLLPNNTVTQRLRYTMASVTNYRTGPLQPSEKIYALQLPEDANPRTLELAQQWRATISDDGALVAQALDYLRTEPFYYTRQPPALGSEPVDQFLFETRAGFCEHYASAFVTLMRAADIPSRVVTGYQGGDFNSVGKFLEVRQNSAHAWAEVWLPERGWVRIDPTAVIPAQRILANSDTARFQSSAVTGTFDMPVLHSGLKKLMQGWSAMNYAWSVWVIGFNAERQQALFSKWGLDKLGLRSLLSMMLVAIGIILAVIALVVIDRRPRSSDPVHHLYQRFCRRLAKAGIACPAHEGPQQLAARAMVALPQHAATIRDIIDRYVALRYGRADANQLMLLKRQINRFNL